MASALKCFGSFWVDDIASTIINGISLLIVICIGLMAHLEFQQTDDKRIRMIRKGQRLFFYSAILATCTAALGAIGQNVFCMMLGIGIEWVMVLICFTGYVTLLMCVLGVFVLRLFDTFHGSLIALSSTKQRILSWLYMAMVLMWTMVVFMFFHVVFAEKKYTEEAFVVPAWSMFTLFIALIIFTILSIWTVYEFCHRLLLTAKLQSQWTRTKGLDKKQIQIINVSAKYLSLFMFAMVTTLINFALFSLCTFHHLDPSTTLGFELISNITTLYLQFPFAEAFYYRCCGRLDVCCRRVITWRLGKHDQSIKAKRAITGAMMGAAPTAMTKDERNIAQDMDSYVVQSSQRTADYDGDGPREFTITSFNDGVDVATSAASSGTLSPPNGFKKVPTASALVTSSETSTNGTANITESSQPPHSTTTEARPAPCVSQKDVEHESTWNLSNTSKSEPPEPVTVSSNETNVESTENAWESAKL